MKDEIKEHMQNCIDREESCLLNSDNTKLLLDYITNLQEKNERLKKENIKLYKKDTKIINGLKEDLKITQEKWDKDKQFSKCRTMEMLDYKSRNEKAIEFVKKESKKCYSNQTTDNPQKVIGNFMWHTDKLLNILGGDEE